MAHTGDGSTRTRVALFAAVALCLAIVGSPQLAAAEDGVESTPQNALDASAPRDEGSHTRWPLLGAGIGALGVSWASNALVSLGAGQCGPRIEIFPDSTPSCTGDPEWDPFRATGVVPLAGPFIQLTQKPGSLGDDYWAPWLVFDGAVQLAGLTMIVVALVSPREDERAAQVDDDSPVIVPDVGPSHAGIAAIGRF